MSAASIEIIHEETYGRSIAGRKDETTEVSSALIAEGAGGVDESADAVRLQRGAEERGTPRYGGAGRLLGPEELLLSVGRLGALVGLSEERREDGEFGAVVEESTEGDSRGLDGGEVCVLMSVSNTKQTGW